MTTENDWPLGSVYFAAGHGAKHGYKGDYMGSVRFKLSNGWVAVKELSNDSKILIFPAWAVMYIEPSQGFDPASF